MVADLCLRADVPADVSALSGAVSGYVVDPPAAARDALEPLMAAYDFIAAEHEGDIVFFHRDRRSTVTLSLGDLAAESAGAAFAQRGDAADKPIEARVRFLDPERDYLIASASARRLDRAEGGVVSVDAPLVLETEAAEALAGLVLAERRSASEALHLALGPDMIALEPGDHLAIADRDDIFRNFAYNRCRDANARSSPLALASRCAACAWLAQRAANASDFADARALGSGLAAAAKRGR